MSAEAPAIERILLPLTMAEAMRSAVAIASGCAQALALPIEALFIEDEELLALAGLTVARATSWQATQRFDLGALAHRLRREAERARALVEAAASAHAIAARFATVRGEPFVALGAATRRSDLLVLAGGADPLWDRRAAREFLQSRETGGLLLLEPQAPPIRAIAAYYSGPADAPALRLAARIAQGLAADFAIVLASAEADPPHEHLRSLLQQLAGRSGPPRLLTLRAAAQEEAQARRGRLIVASRASQREWLEHFIAAGAASRPSRLLLALE